MTKSDGKNEHDGRLQEVLGGRVTTKLDNKSKFAKQIYYLLADAFPYNLIYQEFFCWHKNKKLFFDYYIKEYNLLFEIQGRQHYQYTKHFHTDREGFLESKRRDNLKREYCQKNGYTLVELKYNDKIETAEELLQRIDDALKGDKNG